MVTPAMNSCWLKSTSNLLKLSRCYASCIFSAKKLSRDNHIQSSILSYRKYSHYLSNSSSKALTAFYTIKNPKKCATKLNSIYGTKSLSISSQYPCPTVCPAHEFSTSSSCLKSGSFWSRMFKKNIPKTRLERSGYELYSEISQKTDILHFFKVLSLEDTFFSWFLVIQLQVWLVSVRLMAEGEEGKTARDALISAMWDDALAKLKDLGVRSHNKKADLEEMNSHFQSALISYDEGLLGSDRDLAGAVWRRLIRRDIRDFEFGRQNEEKDDEDDDPVGDEEESSLEHILEPSADPRCLEAMVHYIRQQVEMLDNVDRDTLLLKGKVLWSKPRLPEEF